jgi:hypothetical protein
MPRVSAWSLQSALDARGYGLDLMAGSWEGRCQIIAGRGPGGEPLDPPWPCPGAGSRIAGADHLGRPVRVCDRHGLALQP